MSIFKKADRRKKKLRLALDGPAGSGKTLTALRFAMVLARHEAAKAGRPDQPRVAVIDTENGSASIYQGDVYDEHTIEFDVIELADFSPTRYSEITKEAARLGYDVLVIDSLSHAWSGKGGALELVDKAADKVKGNSFAGWKDITPLQTEMIETIIRSSCHILATMRTKTEWVLEINERGKQVPRKVGMAPVQRQGVEYEFDVVLDIDEDHIARVTKSRCSAIADKASTKPGAEFMGAIVSWLDHGSDIPQEVLDRAALVDSPSQSGQTIGVSGNAGQAPAALSEDDLATRMAAKRAKLQGVEASAPTATPSPSLAESAPAVTTPATVAVAAATVAVPGMITAEQITMIGVMFEKANASPEQRLDAIKRRKANSLEELTEEAANNLISGLRAIILNQAPPTTVVANPDASAAAASGPAMITEAQQNEIRKMFEQLGAPPEARVMAYQKRGAKALAELTLERADDLIHVLRGRITGLDQLPANKPTVPDHPQYANAEQRELAMASGAAS